MPKKNQERAEKKVELIRELLRGNPYANPDDIMAKVIEAFPSGNPSKPGGVSKVLIAKVRWDDLGLRLGPGGRIFDRKGQWIAKADKQGSLAQETKQTKAQVNNVDASQKRLQNLVTALRQEMAARNIDRVDVPLQGQVHTTRRVQEDFTV